MTNPQPSTLRSKTWATDIPVVGGPFCGTRWQGDTARERVKLNWPEDAREMPGAWWPPIQVGSKAPPITPTAHTYRHVVRGDGKRMLLHDGIYL